MIQALNACRICGNANLVPILDLGRQVLTGVFPKTPDQEITSGPLELLKCTGTGDVCGLVQLSRSYDLAEMYGLNYGYRSGLNPSMVRHLHAKVARVREHVALERGDVVIDIGSNDSTTLQAYTEPGLTLVGIDPTGVKFSQYYPAHVELIADFFSATAFKERFGERRAKVVTSFSIFYDLENPLAFMRDVHEVLAEDGIWTFEQSYLPAMLSTNSYDTVCHEHLEYYALKQIRWMADRVGFSIVDVEFNDVNGGSFSVVVRKKGATTRAERGVDDILEDERKSGLDSLEPYRDFERRVAASRDALLRFVEKEVGAGRRIAALGASTKGNVLLQYCGLSSEQIECIGEVNAEKYGAFTPGTLIPIVPEEELLATHPDYLLVLPWHFRRHFETSPRFKGRKLVFPLPRLEVVQP